MYFDCVCLCLFYIYIFKVIHMKFLQNFESVDKRKGKKNMLDYVYTLRDKILSVDFIMVVDIVFLRLEHV